MRKRKTFWRREGKIWLRSARKLCRAACLCLIALAALGTGAEAAEVQNVPYESYTTGAYGDVVERAAFVPKKTVTGASLGIANFNTPQDVFYDNNGHAYLLDSGNSRLLVLDSDLHLQKSYNSFTYQGKQLKFTGAQSVFVSPSKEIYLSDTQNQRVLICNPNGQVDKILTAPKTSLLPAGFRFQPIKALEDRKGFIYVLSKGSYYGLMIYLKTDDSFLGFYGSNEVNSNPITAVSRMFNMMFSNKTLRSKSIQKLPYQITGFCLGPDDFIYSLTSVSESGTGQLRELGPGGNNIMTFENGYRYQNADAFDFSDGSSYVDDNGESRKNNFSNLAVDSQGYLYLLDTTYGKIFMYDEKCNVLSIFGAGMNAGTQQGTFQQPAALAAVGNNIWVVDSAKNSITVLGATPFCELIKKADQLNLSGDYEQALPYWEKVNQLDSYFELAYSGMAKGYLVKGNYVKAMQLARESHFDQNTYAQAFLQVRTQFVTRYFPLLFSLLFLVVAGVVVLLIYTAKTKAVLIGNEKLRVMFNSAIHPFDQFSEIKYKRKGSALFAALLFVVFYVFNVIDAKDGGFMYVTFNPLKFNALFTLLGTVGLLLLWVVVNWGVCTLLEGKGKIGEIFISTGYCLLPLILYLVLFLILSHVLVPDESAFLNVLKVICYLWSGILFLISIMTIHEYGFMKAIGTSILTILAMMLTAFIIVMVCTLLQDFIGFIVTIAQEIIFRYNA